MRDVVVGLIVGFILGALCYKAGIFVG